MRRVSNAAAAIAWNETTARLEDHERRLIKNALRRWLWGVRGTRSLKLGIASTECEASFGVSKVSI
jgi:hypothetical protein